MSTVDPKLLDRDPERVARMFGEISPRYDLLNRVLSCGLDGSWRRRAVELAEPASARRVLDLATGTGDLAFEFLRHPQFAGNVVGLDFSEPMVHRAREKATARGCAGRVRFERGDALDLAEGDCSFDVVSVAFGVRNFADPPRALGEALRVLAPGGRLVVVDFFRKPESPAVRWYLDHVLPRVGSWISKSRSAYAYLRASKEAFFSPEELGQLLATLGGSRIKVCRLTFGIAHVVKATKPLDGAAS